MKQKYSIFKTYYDVIHPKLKKYVNDAEIGKEISEALQKSRNENKTTIVNIKNKHNE